MEMLPRRKRNLKLKKRELVNNMILPTPKMKR